jgi:hypothetical protein
MHSFSLIAEEGLNLSQSEKHYFGGDGDTWITTGIQDYFPQATFILCRFYLFKRLCESLFNQEAYFSPVIQASIPVLDGPHQDKP